MKYSGTIIIGGGPAGASCALKLKQAGKDCIILEQARFPRTKLCAGWITPEVYNTLEMDKYPRSMITFDRIHFNIWGFSKTARVKQHSIRRYEFDDWLLKKSKAKVYRHKVSEIKKVGDDFVIDGKFRCRYLVGAGGTYCPVYRTFFSRLNPRSKKALVVAMEEEFKYNYKDKRCHLWFFGNKLPGYAWYVPKGKGYINVGIGCFADGMRSGRYGLTKQWEMFTKKLDRLSLVTGHKYKSTGYMYYVRQNVSRYQNGNAFIVGDSAGLATQDLAEGIGPAVKSGMLAAKSIITGKKYSLKGIKKNSVPGLKAIILRLGMKIARFF